MSWSNHRIASILGKKLLWKERISNNGWIVSYSINYWVGRFLEPIVSKNYQYLWLLILRSRHLERVNNRLFVLEVDKQNENCNEWIFHIWTQLLNWVWIFLTKTWFESRKIFIVESIFIEVILRTKFHFLLKSFHSQRHEKTVGISQPKYAYLKKSRKFLLTILKLRRSWQIFILPW